MSSRYLRVAIFIALAGVVSTAVYLQVASRTSLRDLRALSRIEKTSCVSSDNLDVLMADLDQRLKRDPEAPLTLVELARVSFSLGVSRADDALIEKAESSATRSLTLAPHANRGATEILARVASHGHEFNRAGEISQELISAGSNVGYQIGVSAFLARGMLREARALAVRFRAAEISPASSFAMGMVEENSGNYELAERYFKIAIGDSTETASESPLWTRSILARFYIRRARFKEAAVVLQSIRECDQDYLHGVSLSGELSLATGDQSAASTAFTRAFELSRDPRYLRLLAWARQRAGDSDGWRSAIASAISLYETAALSRSSYHRALHAQALLDRDERPHDVERAIALLEQERARRQGPDIMGPLSYAYRIVGRQEEAAAIDHKLLEEGYPAGGQHEPWNYQERWQALQ